MCNLLANKCGKLENYSKSLTISFCFLFAPKEKRLLESVYWLGHLKCLPLLYWPALFRVWQQPLTCLHLIVWLLFSLTNLSSSTTSINLLFGLRPGPPACQSHPQQRPSPIRSLWCYILTDIQNISCAPYLFCPDPCPSHSHRESQYFHHCHLCLLSFFPVPLCPRHTLSSTNEHCEGVKAVHSSIFNTCFLLHSGSRKSHQDVQQIDLKDYWQSVMMHIWWKKIDWERPSHISIYMQNSLY